MHTNEQSKKGKQPAMTTGESDAGASVKDYLPRWHNVKIVCYSSILCNVNCGGSIE